MLRIPKPFPIWATLLTILGFMILCALGTWQVQRLQWKQDLMHQIEVQYEQPPQVLPESSILAVTDTARFTALSSSKSNRGAYFARGIVTGEVIPGKTIFLQGRPFPGESEKVAMGTPGVYVLVPVRTSETTILVNLGWTNDRELPAFPAKVSLTGIVHEPVHTPFMPDNNPDENIWYTPDLQQMAKALKLDLAPAIFDSETIVTEKIIPISRRPELNNNHRQYAFFWYSLAAALLLIYVLRFWRAPSPQ